VEIDANALPCSRIDDVMMSAKQTRRRERSMLANDGKGKLDRESARASAVILDLKNSAR